MKFTSSTGTDAESCVKLACALADSGGIELPAPSGFVLLIEGRRRDRFLPINGNACIVTLDVAAKRASFPLEQLQLEQLAAHGMLAVVRLRSPGRQGVVCTVRLRRDGDAPRALA